MRLGITAKLFGAILLTNIVMAAAFASAIHFGITHAFQDYIREREQRRLGAFAQVLSAAYAEHGSWDFLRDEPGRWAALSRQVGPFLGGPEGRGAGPGRPGPLDRQWGPPPKPGAPLPGEGEFGRGPRRPGEGHLPGITLVDRDRRPVAGRATPGEEPAFTQAVVVDGATVGWLLRLMPAIPGPEAQFQEQLLKTGWAVAGIALLLAAAAAFPMARGLLFPIRRLAEGTKRLAAADYDSPVPIHSDDELGQLTRDFNRLAESLKGAEQARRGFLADVSHELRTPVAILRVELEALQDGVRQPTPEAIQSLRSEVLALERLVNDLYSLAVADLGPGAYAFEDVDVAALARSAADAFSERVAAAGLAIDTSGLDGQPVVARGDARWLGQVLRNLLENSVRYTHPGGRIRLAAHLEGGEAVIDVMDSAPGVPEESLPRLFDRLFRVEPSRSREHGGAGIGLSLCRSVVQAHGGCIEAKPSPQGGLWIRIVLPAGSERPAA
jgi:two-component system sensor histidine kinase BaeS